MEISTVAQWCVLAVFVATVLYGAYKKHTDTQSAEDSQVVREVTPKKLNTQVFVFRCSEDNHSAIQTVLDSPKLPKIGSIDGGMICESVTCEPMADGYYRIVFHYRPNE